MNSDYHETWSYTKETTRSAMKSGITTIIDYPMMNREENFENILSSIKSRKRSLEYSKLYTDIALMSHLCEEMFNKIPEILKEGVYGFCGYLNPCMNPDMPHIKTDDFLLRFFHYLEKFDIDTAVAIFCEQADPTELKIASPYRSKPLEDRLQYGLEVDLNQIKDSYKDGDLELKIDKLYKDFENAELENGGSSDDDNSLDEQIHPGRKKELNIGDH